MTEQEKRDRVIARLKCAIDPDHFGFKKCHMLDVCDYRDDGRVKMEKLRECPFCGGDADIAYNTKFGWSVYCTNDRCFMNTLTMGTDFEEAAIVAWNRRVTDEPQRRD